MFLNFVDFVMGVQASAYSHSAKTSSAWAKMVALGLEKSWNLNVMRQQKKDLYARNILEAYGSGVNPITGSTGAVISNNQQVLQDEINFREQQYNMELKNLEAQSKQKFLGIF